MRKSSTEAEIPQAEIVSLGSHGSALLESKSQSKQEIQINQQEIKGAKVYLYKALFRNWFARLAVLPSILVGAVPSLFYLVFGEMVNALTDTSLTTNDKSKKMTMFCIYFVIIAVIGGFFRFFDAYFWIRCGTQLSVQIRSHLFQGMMQSDVSFFDMNSIGGILTLLSEDSAAVQQAFGSTKSDQIQNLSAFLIGTTLSFVYSWRQALIALLVFPILALLAFAFSSPLGKFSDSKFKFTSDSMTVAEEALANIRTIKAFNKEDSEAGRFEEKSRSAAKLERKIGYLICTMMCLFITTTYVHQIGSLYYGGYLVTKKILKLGDVFGVFGFTYFACFGIFSLQNTMQNEEKALSSGARILKLTHHIPDIPFEGGDMIEDFRGQIEFRNVSFKYPTRDAYALQNVSFVINPDEMVALVGHSGSGKSTCVQLIERFYDVEEGLVLLDGKDVKTLDPRWLHRQIALVSQDPTLFKASIRENISYGSFEATEDEITEAAEIANASKFILKREKGFDAEIGEKGNGLSGGQKQRIAIARAVIKNPKVLITDEATSALDAESEKKVQNALDKVMEGRTAVIVAHRLSTIRNADKIYVFDAGEIKESGKHQDLVEKGGYYYNLVKRQLNKDQ